MKLLLALTVILIGAAVFAAPIACLAAGPNLMINAGLEGGAQQYKLQTAFSIVDDPANSHSGTWSLLGQLNQTYGTAYQTLSCWPNSAYTSSVWYKGSGSATFEIMAGDWKTVVQSVPLVGSSKWRHATISWNSGSLTSAMIMVTDNIGQGSLHFDDFYTGLAGGQTIEFDGVDPPRSHPKFNLLFDDEFDSSKTIDVNNTGNGGYNWYLKSFYGSQYDNNSSMFSVADGVLTLRDSGDKWSEVLDTAHPANNSDGFIGTAFSAGDGVYAVAGIAILNIDHIGSTGWPSWWSGDMKGETGKNKDMPGNPGHVESIENDFMEYNPNWGSSGNWYSTMHDWGDPGTNIGNSNSTITPPVGTDYTQYHTYGMLWVPASAANSWIGYRQAYFDGIPQQAVCWKGNQTYSGAFPMTAYSLGSYAFSLTDKEQFMLILGSSQGGIPTMNVDYVRVYAVNKSSMTIVKP